MEALNWDAVEEEDLNEPLRFALKKKGWKFVRELHEVFAGDQPYIPTLSDVARRQLDQKICEDYDGTNILEVCSRYSVSRRYVKRVTSEEQETA